MAPPPQPGGPQPQLNATEHGSGPDSSASNDALGLVKRYPFTLAPIIGALLALPFLGQGFVGYLVNAAVLTIVFGLIGLLVWATRRSVIK